MRGEQTKIAAAPLRQKLSPPLARGTDFSAKAISAALGITPACAGNSQLLFISKAVGGDHPRLRGEQDRAIAFGNEIMGSPPLARRTALHVIAEVAQTGITPACAGNSLSAPMKSLGAEDHPRLRGEQAVCAAYVYNDIGSPPLARGTGGLDGARDKGHGITPACAGNRDIINELLAAIKDHPRLRGEQSSNFDIRAARSGSPPLARGTDLSQYYIRCMFGITPACAGNSRGQRNICRRIWDHPRLRGEQVTQGLGATMHEGSPPLARGTGRFPINHGKRIGITPACAGNRGFFRAARPSFRDHPRLRGEQCTVLRHLCRRQGSPPLARGTGGLDGARD